jgi:hypothetical protein
VRISFVSLPDVNEKLALICSTNLAHQAVSRADHLDCFMLFNDVVNVTSVMNERVWNTGGLRLTGSGPYGFAV